MSYKKYAGSVQLFLWIALIVNFISLTISIIYKIPLLTGLSLLLSLYIIMIKKRHQMNFTSGCIRGNAQKRNFTFFQYIKSLLFSKGFDMNNEEVSSNIRSSVHFIMNPDTQKEEGILFSSIPKMLEVNELKRIDLYTQNADGAGNFLFGYDIPDLENSNMVLNEGVELAADMEDFFLLKSNLHNHQSSKRKIVYRINLFDLQKDQREKLNYGILQNLNDKRVMAIEIDCKPRTNGNEEDLSEKYNYNLFKNSSELLYKINFIKELSNGKPVGIKSVFRNSQEFISLFSAINDTGMHVDFISIEGSDSYNLNNNSFIESAIPKPYELEKAVFIANEIINRFSLQNKIKIWATGKIENGFELVKLLSLGATNCINTNFISSITAVKSDEDIENKDYYLFKVIEHHNKIKRETLEILKYAGFSNFNNIDQKRFFKIINRSTIKRLDDCFKTELYQFNKNKEFMHLN